MKKASIMTTCERASGICLILVLLAAANASAQRQVVVNSVRFSGNDNVRAGTLETLVRTSSNRELLGVPGFKVWLWLNNLNGNWGEEPSLLNRTTVAADIERITTYYRSIGYLDNRVDTLITEFTRGKVEVSFLINEGRRTSIRTVRYSGIPDTFDENMRQRLARRSAMMGTRIDDTTYTVNKPLTFELIGQERGVILELLKNNGYASATNDSIRAIVRRDSLNPSRADLLFRITPGRTYLFGNAIVSLDGPTNETSPVRVDTVDHGKALTIARKEDDALARFRLIHSNIAFTPGTPYNHDLYLQTIRRFQNLGMVNVRQFSLSEDGSLPDFSRESLPVRIDLQTLPRQRIRADISGLQRIGFGAGAGVTYTNNNLFGMAEKLQLSVKGSFENAAGASDGILRSLETSMEYSVPRLNFPFARFNSRSAFINSRTTYGLSLAQINQINFNVNANLRFNLKYDIQHRSTLSSTLDLVELDWFDASPSNEFRRQIEQDFANDPFLKERILADFSQQFNSTVRYTIRSFNTDLIKRNRGTVSEFAVESGGNIPWLIEKYLVRPGEPLLGTIPSLTFADSTLSYTRFVKASFDHRRYLSLFSSTVLSWRFFTGAAYAYAENKQIPLNRRFFAGGSNDIRGWPPLRLGPGDVDQVTINGGDIKIATFFEARQLVLRNVFSTDWHGALYADIGNIWYGPGAITDRGKFRHDQFWKELAIGAGYGIRLDWEYIIFRIDVAYRAYDPAVVGGIRNGWFQNPNPYIHFGIGHSF